MKPLLLIAFLVCLSAIADKKPVASGPLKVFHGPEGEVLAIVDVNDSKEAAVYFRGVGGELEGKTHTYLIEQGNRGERSLYYNKKIRGTKYAPWYVLRYTGKEWRFTNPAQPGVEMKLKFSKEDTKKMKIEEVLNAYQPIK
jgi:hypothetical protein